jgi:hypothetical protein
MDDMLSADRVEQISRETFRIQFFEHRFGSDLFQSKYSQMKYDMKRRFKTPFLTKSDPKRPKKNQKRKSSLKNFYHSMPPYPHHAGSFDIRHKKTV